MTRRKASDGEAFSANFVVLRQLGSLSGAVYLSTKLGIDTR